MTLQIEALASRLAVGEKAIEWLAAADRTRAAKVGFQEACRAVKQRLGIDDFVTTDDPRWSLICDQVGAESERYRSAKREEHNAKRRLMSAARAAIQVEGGQ